MFTLSIILNLHREGILAEKAIKNLRSTLLFSKKRKSWDKIEIVAVLDNTNDETRQVVFENRDIIQKIEEVTYKDLASSRNHGIKAASNHFILFADGDDYISHNALAAIYKIFYSHYSDQKAPLALLPMTSHIAVFPEWLIDFPTLHFQHYKNSNRYITANMRFAHCFVSRICCPKVIFDTHQLRKNEHPYGYEDWDYNNQLLAEGVQFKIAKNYILYYRVGNAASMLQKQIQNHCILRNSKLYDINSIALWSIDCDEKNNQAPPILSHLERKGLITKLLIKLNQWHLEKKARNFLSHYGEINLAKTKSQNLFHDMHFVSHDFISTSVIYENILLYLKNSRVLFLVSERTLDKAVITLNELNDPSDIGICIITESEQPIAYTGRHLNLDSLTDWRATDLNNKMHIVLKAIINSTHLETIVNFDSALVNNMIERYVSVVLEHGKKIERV